MAEGNSASARRRKRRKAAQGGSVWKTLLAAAARLPWRAGRAGFAFASAHKRGTALVACGIAFAAATNAGLATLRTRAHDALPESARVEAPTRALREQVERIAADALARARQAKSNREALIALIGARLGRIDAVDTYEVRAGLDRRLQIRVTSQVPLFVLEGQGKERALVGHKMKILQRKLGPADYPHLLRIVTPDYRVAQALPAEPFASGPTAANAPGTPHAARFTAPLNFAWLANQGSRVREAVRKQKMNVVLEEIAWRSATGFVLELKDADAAGRTIKVSLGEGDLDRKITRLPEILSDLRAKGLAPADVDLNYSDKALIRLSEAGTPPQL